MTNKGDPYYESNLTDLSLAIFRNVTMDGLKIEHAKITGVGEGTRLLLINLDMKMISYALSFNDVHVRIKNCKITGKRVLIRTLGFGSVYATECIFDGTGFSCRADVAYVENCKLLNGAYVGDAKTIVIKDSIVSGSIGSRNSDMVYLINNTYTDTGKEVEGIAIMGREDSKIYLDGRNKKRASVNILGGGAYIKDLELITPVIERIETSGDPIEPYTLDLNNVTIRGGSMNDLRLRGGRWQDVTIYPPIVAPNAQVKNVYTYNVTYPEGPPWRETDGNTKIEFIPSPKPFDFPEIKAPTSQDLGLVD
jgi:hypothetical protein